MLWRSGVLSHSSSCIAAKEGIEHWLFQALLVLPTPGNHGPVTIRRVQMVAVTGKCKAGKRNPCVHYLLKLRQHIGDHIEISVKKLRSVHWSRETNEMTAYNSLVSGVILI